MDWIDPCWLLCQNDFAKARDGDGVNESLRTIELGPVQWHHFHGFLFLTVFAQSPATLQSENSYSSFWEQLLFSLRTITLQAGNNFSVRALEVELPSSAQQGMLSMEKHNKQNFMAHRSRLTPGKALARCRQGEENIFLNMIWYNIIWACEQSL